MTTDGYALLVVDMQNGFCHPDGSFPRIGRGLENAMEAVGNAAVAVTQARQAGVPVVRSAPKGAALPGPRARLAGGAVSFGVGAASGHAA